MQYRVESLKISLESIREQLKEIGKDGWELITIVHQPNAYKSESSSGYLAYFKR